MFTAIDDSRGIIGSKMYYAGNITIGGTTDSPSTTTIHSSLPGTLKLKVINQMTIVNKHSYAYNRKLQ